MGDNSNATVYVGTDMNAVTFGTDTVQNKEYAAVFTARDEIDLLMPWSQNFGVLEQTSTQTYSQVTSIIITGGPASSVKVNIGVITVRAIVAYEPVDTAAALVALRGPKPSLPMDNMAVYVKTYHDEIFFL